MRTFVLLSLLTCASITYAEEFVGFTAGYILDHEAKHPNTKDEFISIYLKGVSDGIVAIDMLSNKKDRRAFCFSNKMPTGLELYSLVSGEIISMKQKMNLYQLKEIPLAFIVATAMGKTFPCE